MQREIIKNFIVNISNSTTLLLNLINTENATLTENDKKILLYAIKDLKQLLHKNNATVKDRVKKSLKADFEYMLDNLDFIDFE